MHVPDWDLRCEKCGEDSKKFNGCEEDSYIPERWKIGEWIWQRCPIKLITEQTLQYLKVYNLLQLGISPYQQGWLKESNKYMEAMEIIGTEVRRIEAINLRQMRKK